MISAPQTLFVGTDWVQTLYAASDILLLGTVGEEFRTESDIPKRKIDRLLRFLPIALAADAMIALLRSFHSLLSFDQPPE